MTVLEKARSKNAAVGINHKAHTDLPEEWATKPSRQSEKGEEEKMGQDNYIY